MTREEYEQKYGIPPEEDTFGIQEEDEASRDNSFLDFLKGIGVGVAKSAGEAIVGAGEIGRRIQGALPLPERFMGGESIFDKGSSKNVAARESLKADASGEGVGKFVGTAAQYLAPTRAIVGAQQKLGAVAQLAPKGTQILAKATARAVPEAVGTGAVSAVRSGGDTEATERDAKLAGAFSLVFGSLGSLARASYYPQLNESVTRALGIQGKTSGAQAVKEVGKKIAGLTVLKKYADDLKVVVDDGVEQSFNPSKATYQTTIQAWDAAKDKVFNAYDDIATKAGERAVVDLNPILEMVDAVQSAPTLSAHKNAARTLASDIRSAFPDATSADIKSLQTFLKTLNANTAQGFFKGTSDNASAEVFAGTAKLIREKLDEVIASAGDARYGSLRQEYAALKSIEDDLVRRFKQDARKIGGGLPEYAGMFASGDIISGLLRASPGEVARGTLVASLAALKRKLSNPERFLRRSFELIDEEDTKDIWIRLFGGRKN